jgi:predicted Zn-dependent peptidase
VRYLIIFFLGVFAMATDLKYIDIRGEKIPLIFEHNKQLPIATIQFIFQNSGALNTDKDALAELSSKLLNEGTKKDGSTGFATKLDNQALTLSSYVGRESFVIEVSGLKSEFPDGIKLLQALFKDPNYTEETITKIKRQKIGSLTAKLSDYDYIANVGLRKLLFEGTPLARSYEGQPKKIEKITVEDIKIFLDSHLGFNNVLVLAGGDISEKEVVRYSKEVVSLLPKVESQPLVPTSPRSMPKTEFHNQKDTQQAYIYFGSPFYYSYKEPDQYKAKIMEYILGSGGFGSRIMEEIRVKRGLAYSVYASLNRTKNNSHLSGYLQTKLESQDEAMKVVKDVIDDFIKNGITQDELTSAKEFLVGSEPLRVETLSQRLNRGYDEYYNDREQGYSKIQLEQLASVTLKEMNEFIASHPEIRELSFSVVTKAK